MRTLRPIALLALLACNGRQPASGPPVPDDRALCTALCERIAACGPPEGFPGAPECARICIADQARLVTCRDARVAYERCAIPLSCADLHRLESDPKGPDSPCAAQARAVIACDPTPDASIPFIDFQF